MVLQQSYTYTCYTINHLVIERRAVSLPVTLTADGFSSCPAISLILTQWRSLRPGLHRAESRGRCCLNSSTRTFICTHKHAHTNSNKTKYVCAVHRATVPSWPCRGDWPPPQSASPVCRAPSRWLPRRSPPHQGPRWTRGRTSTPWRRREVKKGNPKQSHCSVPTSSSQGEEKYVG